jgi:choice-of-anchor A domain-containing protein
MRHLIAARPAGRGLIAAALIAGSLSIALSPAKADTLTAAEILSQFNAVVVGDFGTTSDVEGRLVAGTIDNTNSSTFYENPNSLDSPSSFAGVNALTIASCPSCNVNNGGSVNYVNSNAGSFNFNSGGGHPKGSLVQNSPAFSMSEFTTPLNKLEVQLGKLTANSTINASDPNNFTFNINPIKGVAVFDVSATTLESARNLVFSNLTSSDTIIINVTGATFAQDFNFNAPTTAFSDQVIWNFEGATNLSFTNWHGAILAGAASVTNTSPLEGFLYADSFNGKGELHDRPFTGVLTPGVPEPATWAMMGLGFIGLGLMGWRKSRPAALATAQA